MSGLPEPWRLTVGPVRKRLRNQNPAVLDVLDANLESWEAGLHTLVSQGATDEEIWQGDWLTLLPLPVRRLLPELLVAVRRQFGVSASTIKRRLGAPGGK